MKVLVIEDEYLAAERLQKMLTELDPNIQILDTLESVEDALNWFSTHPFPDLVFLDIHLADADAFEILRQYPDSFPVIFTTAYDQYAVEAFKYHSVDYLLKPLKPQNLAAAYQKFLKRNSFPFLPSNLLAQTQVKQYQKRILLRFGPTIKAIPIDQIAYFYIESKLCFLKTFDNRNYPVDQNLDQLSQMVDPQVFFRINRQLLVSFVAIKEMSAFSKSRVQLQLSPISPVEALVSTERSALFKTWLKGVK
ncbi:MAG: LytR/AlgR family response regulator transcription factor [Bacteroidia bacterium]